MSKKQGGAKTTNTTMPQKAAESTYEKWTQKLPDFTLVAKSGEELKCHKIILAMNSPFFKTMLTGQASSVHDDCFPEAASTFRSFRDARSNRATMKDFDAAVNVSS